MKRLGVFLLPLDGMLVHRRSLPHNLLGFPNKSPVPIYTPGWREAPREWSVLPKNTTQCPRPGLEPGPLAPGTNALTIRPLRLPLYVKKICEKKKLAINDMKTIIRVFTNTNEVNYCVFKPFKIPATVVVECCKLVVNCALNT